MCAKSLYQRLEKACDDDYKAFPDSAISSHDIRVRPSANKFLSSFGDLRTIKGLIAEYGITDKLIYLAYMFRRSENDIQFYHTHTGVSGNQNWPPQLIVMQGPRLRIDLEEYL